MLQNETKVDRRTLPRESVQLPARYLVKHGSFRYQDCTVVNISRGGAAVLLPGYEFIKENVHFYLDLIVPKTLSQISVRGQVRVKYRKQGCLVAGIQFDSLLPESTFYKLVDTEPIRGWHGAAQKQIDYYPAGLRLIGRN